MTSFTAEQAQVSKPRKIVRKCPVLVDVIVILIQLGLLVTLGFFSYYYPSIKVPCYAAYPEPQPIGNGGATIGRDVTRRFKIAIRFGFYLSILNFLRVVANQVGIWLKSPLLYYIAIVMYGINFMLALVWFMFMQIWRFSYDGKVCSGDHLTSQEKEAARGQGIYLIAEGNFLKDVIITIYCLFGLLILTIIMLALFCSTKRTQAELDARKGGLFKTEVAPSYEAKYAKNDIRRPSAFGQLVQDITTE